MISGKMLGEATVGFEVVRKVIVFFLAIAMVLAPITGVFAEGETLNGEGMEPTVKPAFCLLKSGENLVSSTNYVGEVGGELYINMREFPEFYSYSSTYYKESGLLLLEYFNHRVLYMNGVDVYREVESFETKGGEGTETSKEGVGEGEESGAENQNDLDNNSSDDNSASDSEEKQVEAEEESVLNQEHRNLGKDKKLFNPVYFENGAVYVSLKDVQNTFGFVDYSFEHYGVIEIPEEVFRSIVAKSDFPYYQTTANEVKDFARLLYYETRDSSLFKKVAVGGVVMNRVYSELFPNTISGVIYAHNQFPPAYYPSFATLEPGALHYEGAVRAINGEDNAPNCLYFNMVPFYGKEADFYKNIEGDYFYY